MRPVPEKYEEALIDSSCLIHVFENCFCVLKNKVNITRLVPSFFTVMKNT